MDQPGRGERMDGSEESERMDRGDVQAQALSWRVCRASLEPAQCRGGIRMPLHARSALLHAESAAWCPPNHAGICDDRASS